MNDLGPFLFNPRSQKVHRSACHYVRRTAFPVEPLASEATTTDEAREQIAKRGLKPCDYCLPWDQGLGHGRRFGERKSDRTDRYVVRDGRSEAEEIEEPWEIVDTETNEVIEAFEWRRHAMHKAKEWNGAVERDPEMTARRYEAQRRLWRASAARKSAEVDRSD